MLSKPDLLKLKRVFTGRKDMKSLGERLRKVLATKEDLAELRKEMFLMFATKDDLRRLEEKIEDKAAVRHSEIFNLVDGLAKEIRDSREFRVVVGHQVAELGRMVRSLVS